jgi:DNA polymerase-3 subunit epsilon
LSDFLAIDFETADRGADSACAVGLVRVRRGQIVSEASRLIRPPRSRVYYAAIHGLTWKRLRGEPRFAEVWSELLPLLEDTRCLVAHNARFDRAVLDACCRVAGLEPPGLPFVCTVELARRAWGVRPTRLPDVCRYLAIPLRHHDPLSDARAAAQIALAAIADGQRPAPLR